MKRTTLIAAAALTMLFAPAAARAMDASNMSQTASAQVLSDSYSPERISVLTGDSVTWTVTARFHTVSADDGSWSSARLFTGDSYTHQFMAAGTVTYYCMVHPFMHGEVDVSDILLNPATAPAAPRKPYPLTGRAALPEGTTLSIESNNGDGFAPITTTVVQPDGSFSATVTPTTTTTYRVLSGTTVSPAVTLTVLDHTVTISDARRGGRDIVSVQVSPSSPGATVVLQLLLRERFGWWPQLQTRLDRNSRARFVLRLDRRVPARVALTLPDGATQLALSKSIRIGSRPR